MAMQDVTLWWITAGLLVATELATGTFYLLMLALGAVAGALAAHLGLGLNAQLVAAALVGGGATAGWHLHRAGQRAGGDSGRNPDVQLDIGQTVHVPAWQPDGSAEVHYRGAQWRARLSPSTEGAMTPSPLPGTYRICGLDGSQLILEKA